MKALALQGGTTSTPSGLPLLFVCLCAIRLVAAEPKDFKNLGIDEFDKMRKEKNTLVLDVRTPLEFAAGHIPGATNIDWYASDFADKVSKLDKSKTYLVHCASGGRSAKACAKLKQFNFKECHNLVGGFKAWEKGGKPVEK